MKCRIDLLTKKYYFKWCVGYTMNKGIQRYYLLTKWWNASKVLTNPYLIIRYLAPLDSPTPATRRNLARKCRVFLFQGVKLAWKARKGKRTGWVQRTKALFSKVPPIWHSRGSRPSNTTPATKEKPSDQRSEGFFIGARWKLTLSTEKRKRPKSFLWNSFPICILWINALHECT